MESHVVYVDIILIFLTYVVCYMCNFRLWCNVRDKNETRFPRYGLKAVEKKLGIKVESHENVETKMWF